MDSTLSQGVRSGEDPRGTSCPWSAFRRPDRLPPQEYSHCRREERSGGCRRWSPVDVTALPKSAPLTRLPGPESVADRELIVVADDNADMRKYLRRLLDGRYEVHTVSDGRQALETTRLLRPSLLLADVMMPQLDGSAYAGRT